MLKLGILLIFVSVIIFVAALAVPDAIKPLAPLLCQPGEQLTSQTYTYSRPGASAAPPPMPARTRKAINGMSPEP